MPSISKFPQLVHQVPHDRTEHEGDDRSGGELLTETAECRGHELPSERTVCRGHHLSGDELAIDRTARGDDTSGEDLPAARTEHDGAVGFVAASCDDSSYSTVFLPVRLLF